MATALSPEHKTLSDTPADILLAHYGSTPPDPHGGRGQLSPAIEGRGFGPTGSELATSWAAIPTHINGGSPDPVDDTAGGYPTAAEIIDLLHTRVAILSGGRDRQGRSIITFPAQSRSFEYNRDCIRRVVQYLACIPTEDVREYGFSVVVDGRSSNWQNIKLILRTLQEGLPGQITVVFTIQPGQFWQKQQSSRGHSKEKGKLEFSTEQLSSTDKLIRYVESSQLTSDLGGFLPYNHDLWIKLRLDLERFISSFNALMEHTAHVEQQLVADGDPSDVEVAQECLTRLMEMQEQLRKAPQNTIREGNDLLRALEQGREDAGTSGMTPDKINAQSIIRKLLDKIGQRQMQLDDLWRERKAVLEQSLQLRVFEKSLVKVRFWLKSRGEEQLSSRCDVGTSPEAVKGLLEQHDKFEAKAKHHRTALTQLRRMADRFSGEQLANADSLQRQVAKLTSRFSKFDNLVNERKTILQSSLQLHVNVNEWRGLCQVTSELLKQEMAPTDHTPSSDEGNHGDHMTQLWQVADDAISEAASLIERMKSISLKLPSEGSKGAGPGYVPGVDHVSRLIEEIQNHRHRVGQLAEARRLQGEELRRLHSCERDTSQVIQWLGDMLTQQLLPGHGDVGDSVSGVARLILGHEKFSDNAHKTYKYGLDLVTASQRTRVSCRLDNQPSSALLKSLDAIWAKLSDAMEEVKGHLDTAKEFHGLTEESLSSYTEWKRPLHQLPKTPSLIQDRLNDMTHAHTHLLQHLASALRVGESLVIRLERPLTSDGDCPHPNEATKSSLAFLRGRLGELREASKELDASLPQQVQLLKDFLLYCQFESSIEKVLLWLQEHGLKQMHTFSLIKEGQSSIREQMESLHKLQTQVKVHSVTVVQIRSEADDVDGRIRGFKSDLVTKATTLKTVWDKFTARLADRHVVISLAASFYDNVEEIKTLYSHLETSITTLPERELEQSLAKLDTVYSTTISEGQRLLERFKLSPGDQVTVIQKLTTLMEDLQRRKNGIMTERTKVKGHAPASVARSNGVVSGEVPLTRVPSDSLVSKKYTNMYGELEEEAYKHVEELETKCDVFLSSHAHLRDTPDSAKLLSTQYDDFLLTFDPMETKLERVVQDLTSLCPKMPPLASSIQQLCGSVRGRVEARRVGVETRGRVLRMYDQFCTHVKEVNSDFSVLDEFLSDPVDDSVTMETLQTYKKLMDRLSENYTATKLLGEQFLEVTSEMLTTRVGPRLEVGGACTSVAFDLGDLEGRYPDLVERWVVREKVLTQHMSWQSFKANYDEITTWLRESAGKFLETRVDIGMSLETAEDLLSELGEFEIRAKRIAAEVESLLVQSEALLSTGVRESSELGNLAWDLRCLHDDFRQQLDTRNTSLKKAVSFFMTSDQVRTDMQSAIELCDTLLRQDLPTHLKITSVSTRLVNLQHEGRQLLEHLGINHAHTPDHAHKGRPRSRAKRSESASASELAIKQMLATLQKDFNVYKKSVERRIISPSPQPPNSRGSEIARLSPQPPNPRGGDNARLSPQPPNRGGGKISRQSPQPPNPKLAKGGEITRLSPQPPNPKLAKEGEITRLSPQPPNPKLEKGGEITRLSPKPPNPKLAKSDLKSPPPNNNKIVTKNEKRKDEKALEDDLQSVPVLRVRANTVEATKTKKRSSAILQRIKVFNQKSTKEDAVALKEVGTTFAPRPRANTADPTMSPSLSRKAVSPRQPNPPQPQVVIRRRSPTDVEGVPLRKKGGGITRTERKDKINAIRKIFEASTESIDVVEETAKSEETAKTEETGTIVPSVVKAVLLKDHLPTKQRVVTVTMAPVEKPATPPLVTIETDVTSSVENNYLPDSTDLPVAPSRDTTLPAGYSSLHSRLVRATRSASPQASNQVLATHPSKSGVNSNDSSPIRRASKRPPPLRLSGKVSSLREMFDSQAKETSPSPRLRSGSYSGKSPAGMERGQRGQRFSVGSYEPQAAALLEVSSEFKAVARQHSPDITPKETQEPPARPHPPADRPHPLEDEPDVLEHKPFPKTIQSTTDIDAMPPPRPPSPAVSLEDSASSGSETSEFDFDISSDEMEDSLSEDEGVDGEELDSAPRLSKSVSTVLSELVQSELSYAPSVEVLATVYLPMFSLRHVPTFLQGRGNTVLPNLTHIHTFHRQFSTSLCRDGNGIEDVCQIFIQASDGFQCYVPFLIGMERGLDILSEYGGSFFEDKQRLLGNETSIIEHYYRLKERVVEYDHQLRNLLTAAQKEALHAVELAMEALKVVQKLLRSVDNTLIINSLRGCPHSLAVDHMIRRDVFQGYITHGKKKIREYHVILTADHVIFTRPRGKGLKLYYEFTESLKVSEMHMLETYKSREDTFALCEGNLSADNLRVLTPVFTPLLMKTIWLQEIRPLLQRKHSRRTLVGEEDTPLPYCFHGDNMPRPLDHVTQALDERISTLKRGKSFLKRTGSLRRNKRKPPTGEGVSRTQSVRDITHKREAFIDVQEMGVANPSQHDDAVSRQSQISSSSGGGVAGVQLASWSTAGQFLPVQEDELYLVVQPHTSEREGFLSVEPGQLVEVLDNSRHATWMVLTVARQHGELEMEGFLPSSCLRLATKDEVSASFCPPPISHDLSRDECEAETSQEVPLNNSIEPTESTELERSLDHTPLQSTGQDLSGSITIVPRNHSNQQGESPSSPKDADSAQSSPMITKRLKPPILNLTNATPTLVEDATPTLVGCATPPYHDQGPHLSPMIERRKLWDYQRGEDLTSSIRSLPTTFSPVTPKSNQRFLGYNPMHLPEVTLSYPELGPPAPPTDKRRKAREELSKLREATVQYRDDPAPGSVDEFDPVLVYVAIADFEAVEVSSISLTAGQCIEVLDSSRSDWWLVFSSESGREGWVPACYLGQFTLTDPSSPPPEPFEDVTGELAALMGQSSDEVNRLELYTASFLVGEGPSDAQLQGMFSISHPYVAMTEISAQFPGQISLVQDQSVTVVDSCRDDWWLVRTVGEGAVEGWAPRDQLKPDENIREDSVVEGRSSLATVTSAFQEEELKPTLTTHPPQLTTPSPQLTVPSPQPTTPSPKLTPRRSLPVVHVGGNIPNSAPMWVVLADYKATEGGMLSVGEGELVEVLDISRNEWCLVRPSTRPLEEGWVPMGYLKPYNSRDYANPSLLPPRFHQHSSSSDSDTPSEGLERSPVALSPEGLMVATSNEARTEAKERRRFVLSELANTERDYVDKLNYCLEHYSGVMSGEGGAPSGSAMATLFGNLSDILTFHRDHFLPELQACEINPLKLGNLFVSCEQELRMYVTYCRNKVSSDSVYHDHALYFEERRGELRDRLKLPDYLILPVQRITKYTLLLHDFHKYSVRAALEGGGILSALEVSRGVSTLANNAIHLNMLSDRVSSTELGDLVMQDLFGSQEGHKQLYKERRIFLFERALIHTKRRRDNSDKESYVVKEQLMLRDISMTQDMDPGRLNIITYDMVTGTKFILRAPKTSVRDRWLSRANELIRLAKQNNTGFMRGRSASEPGESLARTPTFMRRSVFKRESTKRKNRPPSSSGRRSVTPDQQEPPDTEYVVMECIVMEGGDDVTLDPGDIVRLVSVESGGVLRVRTSDDPPSEGKILASYLRKKDSVRGIKMEAIPKFTMRPSDMDLLMGTTATISCAFNGYPIPSIIWRKDHELLSLEGERWKITSCSTSSVLEITRLDYEDEGAYSCYITNSQGSDSADMCLNIHGPPSQPLKPSSSKITSSSVKLKWVAPDNDGKALVHSYQVEMLQEGFEEWQPIIQQPRVYFMAKNLLPNTSYHFRVTAINEYGASPPSEATKVVMGVKGRWQSFRRGLVPAITINTSSDSPDGLFDELGLDDQHSRRGSISNVYDVMADELGRGQYGIVHRCVHKRNGTELAAKYVRLRSKRKASIRQEVELLKRIKGKSPNLLEFCDAFEIGRNLVIVTELVPDGELIERIIADNNLTEAVTVGYLGQLLSAVDALHSLSIAHLDIRLENILLSGDTLKLIDLGSAKEMTSDLSPLYTSSVEFAAPEILNHELPTLSADMWSVGVLAYVLLSGISPFFGENIQAIVERIKEARYSFYPSQFEQVSQEAKDFISALLQKTPEYRMTARRACDHPWIRTLRTFKGDKDRATSPWPMARLDVSGLKTFNARRKWVTMSVAIDDTIVFGPRSTICLSPAPPDFEEMARNEAPPHLWDGPTKLQGCVGSKVTISYSVAGNPEPTVVWEHEDVEVISSRHHTLTRRAGVTLVTLTGVRREDEGVWSCTAVNGSGSIAQECHLTVLDIPGPPLDVNAVLLGTNSAMVSWLPPTDTGSCPITSYVIQRKQLQSENWEETTSVSDITAHVVEELAHGVSHVFRVAAANQVGVGGHSEVAGPVAVVTLHDSETDSTCDEVRLKMRSFELDYEKGQEIWRGAYATVLQCRERTTDRLYTAKHMATITTDQKERALAEYDMHHSLSHPRVLAMEDAFLNESHVTLVLEYVSGGTLQDLLSAQPVLTEHVASLYTRKIAEGLEYLHDDKIILVNLSPDNILLTYGHKDIKICDLGLSRYIESGNQLSRLEGRVEYMSPEVVALQPLTTAADVWSLGTITYLMLTGTSPFLGPTPDATVSNISSCTLVTDSAPYSTLLTDARDFVQYRALVRNPRRRLTAVQCQRHQWVQSRRQSSVDSSDDKPRPQDKPHPQGRQSTGFQDNRTLKQSSLNYN